MVVAEGQGARTGDAVQVTAAVGGLDGESPGPDGYDREGACVGTRGGFTRLPAPRSAAPYRSAPAADPLVSGVRPRGRPRPRAPASPPARPSRLRTHSSRTGIPPRLVDLPPPDTMRRAGRSRHGGPVPRTAGPPPLQPRTVHGVTVCPKIVARVGSSRCAPAARPGLAYPWAARAWSGGCPNRCRSVGTPRGPSRVKCVVPFPVAVARRFDRGTTFVHSRGSQHHAIHTAVVHRARTQARAARNLLRGRRRGARVGARAHRHRVRGRRTPRRPATPRPPRPPRTTATAGSGSRTTSRTSSRNTGSTSATGRTAPGRSRTTGCARRRTSSTRSSRACGTRTGCGTPRSRTRRSTRTTSPVTRVSPTRSPPPSRRKPCRRIPHDNATAGKLLLRLPQGFDGVLGHGREGPGPPRQVRHGVDGRATACTPARAAAGTATSPSSRPTTTRTCRPRNCRPPPRRRSLPTVSGGATGRRPRTSGSSRAADRR
ncbi:hypothetical protein SVIOM342S_04008 [Streptomyces violaceorubidus]